MCNTNRKNCIFLVNTKSTALLYISVFTIIYSTVTKKKFHFHCFVCFENKLNRLNRPVAILSEHMGHISNGVEGNLRRFFSHNDYQCVHASFIWKFCLLKIIIEFPFGLSNISVLKSLFETEVNMCWYSNLCGWKWKNFNISYVF